jgi:prepilin-type N-terminal cleavage/methylation domain-containing protein
MQYQMQKSIAILSRGLKSFRGQTLLEVLIALAIFAILSHALFTLVTTTYSINTFNRSRIAARHLAQEKIELIRNMAYDEIGTVGGIPPGNIPQYESVNLNGLTYTVKTTVIYIDDPFDMQAPEDLLPTDYKRASVEITWGGVESSRKTPVRLITDISPQGIEQTTGGGTLSIIVVDSNLQPVNQADVTITSTGTNPLINMSIKTANNGRVLLPGAPPCNNACYKIVVAKALYSQEQTYSSSEISNPEKPNLSVLKGDLTEVTFMIDKLARINVTSYSLSNGVFSILPNISFNLTGQKTIGTDNDDNPIIKYQKTFATGGDGKLTIDSLEWDKYQITTSSSIGDISGINPFQPISLNPEDDLNIAFSVNSHTQNSILVTFVNPTDNQLASVSAKIFDNTGFEASASSGLLESPNFGQVFFQNLSRKFYNLQATISGYLQYSGILDVYNYKEEKIILNPL